MPPLRLTVFGASIVSDWDNPAATTLRALLGALVAAGHDVTFLERRGNRPTVDLLRARGSGALRAFATRYSRLRYRTYEEPTGTERTVWLGREVATSDAVLVLDDAPVDVVEEIAGFASPSLVRLLGHSGNRPADLVGHFDHVLTPLVGTNDDSTLTFGPAVEISEVAAAETRDGFAIVAYGNAVVANALADELADWEPELISPGNVAEKRWTYVPEVELDHRYRRLRRALVLAADSSPLAVARLLLPIAQGCALVGVAVEGEPALPPDLGLPMARPDDTRRALQASATGLPALASLPERYEARLQAREIVQLIQRTLAARRS